MNAGEEGEREDRVGKEGEGLGREEEGVERENGAGEDRKGEGRMERVGRGWEQEGGLTGRLLRERG